MGISTGGLVGMYALSKMEYYGIDHGVDVFISYDAPLKKANIPSDLIAAIQHMYSKANQYNNIIESISLSYLGLELGDLRSFSRQLSSTGVSQMLSAYNSASGFWEEITKYGFPNSPLTVAFSDGKTPGYRFNSSSHLSASWTLDIVVNSYSYSVRVNKPGTGENRNGSLPSQSSYDLYNMLKSSPGITNEKFYPIPGVPMYQTPYSNLAYASDAPTFISTDSSLLLNGQNISPFDKTYVATANYKHLDKTLFYDRIGMIMGIVSNGSANASLSTRTNEF